MCLVGHVSLFVSFLYLHQFEKYVVYASDLVIQTSGSDIPSLHGPARQAARKRPMPKSSEIIPKQTA